MRPVNKEIARAIRYVTYEFVEGTPWDMEMLAEGFAFGYSEPDRFEIADAAHAWPEFTDDTWRMIIGRADYIRAEQGLCPLSERTEGQR